MNALQSLRALCLLAAGLATGARADTPGADKGCMGHDPFAVVEGTLARCFPV